jgi:hypothetical protein
MQARTSLSADQLCRRCDLDKFQFATTAEGRFHIYPVENIDQAMEMLTGVAAGEPDAKGMLPPDCVNYRVAARLIEFSLIRQSFAIGAPQTTGTRRKPRKKQ